MELETPVDEGFAVWTALAVCVVDGGAETDVEAVSEAASVSVGVGVGVGVGEGVGAGGVVAVAAGAGGFAEIT